MPTVAELRAFALRRTLGPKTSLVEAIEAMGYVQADPIRAPARAQDLILMQRVRGYKASDLEKKYAKLGVEEDMLHNYGFVPRSVQRLLHPRRRDALKIELEVPELSEKVLDFVRTKGSVHPRDLDVHFEKQTVGNYWGGNSSATTRVLDALHYRGHLRIVGRDKGIRVYAIADHLKLESIAAAPMSREAQAQGIVELLLKLYAPLPTQSLGYLVSLSGYGAPHLKKEVRAALKNLEAQSVKVDGLTYLWPSEEEIGANRVSPRKVRLLTPFDPLVWDRRRFEHLHGWAYKFEAYTPAVKRKFGYYALPMMWGAEAVGWANLRVEGGELKAEIGFSDGAPKSKTFERELEAELARHRDFLGLKA